MRLTELAKVLGLPTLTVRRVLAGQAAQYRIPPEIVSRVQAEARVRGFGRQQAHPARRRTASRVARPPQALAPTVGVIVTDLSNPFFGSVTAAVEETMLAEGFLTLVATSREHLEREKELVTELRARGAEGLVVAAAGPDHEHLHKLQEEGFPFVLLDRVFDDLECDWVVVENQLAACHLCEALLARGATRIAFLGGQLAASTGRERLEGYRAALRRQHIPFDPGLIFKGEFSVASGRAGAEWLLKLKPPPAGVFCANNRIFLGCLQGLAGAPKEPWASLPFACFDEIPLMEHLARPLVVVSQPERALGKRAAELLITRLRSRLTGPARMGKPYHQELLEVEKKAFGL